MTCKVQSMTLYVWEKSGYFTQQQQQQQEDAQVVSTTTRPYLGFTEALDGKYLSNYCCLWNKRYVVVRDELPNGTPLRNTGPLSGEVSPVTVVNKEGLLESSQGSK